MSKRLLSVFLAICLVFTAFAPAAMAVESGEDAIVNASQTAEESTQSGSHPMTNSNLVQGEKTEVQTHRNNGSNVQGETAGVELTPGEGSWSFEETDLEAEADLRAECKTEALADLKLAAETYSQEEIVTAFVVMEDQPLVIHCDAINKASATAEKALIEKQDTVIAAIEKQVLGGETLKVRYQFTYLTNSFTIETELGNLEKILNIPGVKSVFVAPVYEACDAHTLTSSSSAMVGATVARSELGYTGKGMKIAIIDTGLDMDHPSFAEDPAEPALTEAEIAAVLEDLNAYKRSQKVSADLLYRSAKVPFAFNYADDNLTANHDFDSQGDHGTHVSGIAAANATDCTDVVGMAPDAQIIVMKVFGSNGQGATADNLVAALEDAMTLGCDVVNMSLGSDNGFSSINDEIDLIYERLASQDIVLTVSAGNAGSSTYGNMWGLDLNLTSNVENSTVSQPSTYANAMSIASADNALVKSVYFSVGEEKIFYQDSYEVLLGTAPYSFQDLADMELEYVPVPNLGEEADYAEIDVAGKIALVLRGTISFAEKCMWAESAGAAGVIIWNNNDEDDIFSFGMTTSDEAAGYMPYVPVCLVSYSDGLMMAEAETKALTVSSELADRAASGAGEISSFSSWGTTSDLRLLPDITGIGGDVYSCYDGGGYGLMSGTSMSAPQVAGVTALVMEYLHEKLPNSTDGEIRDLAEALLMSTADVIRDSASGAEYSPRQQGAGLVDADGAILSDSYLTVGGEKPKAELGDNANGVYKFGFEIHNFGDETLTYAISASALIPGVAAAYGQYFMLEEEWALSDCVTFSKDSVTLAPGQKANITATVALTAGDKEFIDAYYPNGTYVEGFVYLTCEGGQDLNLPFMGFYGDWTDAPVFDTAFWYDNGFWGATPVDGLPEGSNYYHTMWTDLGGQSFVLGFNPYAGAYFDEDGNVIYDASCNVVSPNGDGIIDGIEDMYLSLMRNAKEMTITYTVDGEQIHQDSFINQAKSMYNANYGQIIPWVHSWYGTPYNYAGLADGTEVLMTIEAYIDYGNGGKNVMEVPVTVDLTAPALQGIGQGTLDDGTNYLLLQFTEAQAPAAAFVLNPTGTQVYTGTYDAYMYDLGDGVYQAMLPIGEWGTELMVTLCDYAGNESNYMISYTAAGENKPEMDTSALYAYRILDMSIYADEMFGWTILDKTTGVATTLVEDTYEYYSLTAAEYVNGYIFAVDAGYNLVVLEPGLWNRNTVCNLGVSVLDMSWDKTTNTMYLLTKEDGYYYLSTLDVMTGQVATLGSFGYSTSKVPIAMTFDDNGTLYAVKPYSNNLFTVDLSTLAMTAVTDADGANVVITLTDGTKVNPNAYSQSMTYSSQDHCIYWAYGKGSSAWGGASALVTINMDDYTTSGVLDEYMCEYVGLLMLEEDEDYSLPFGGEPVSMMLSNDSLVLPPEASAELSISVMPWDCDVSAAVWTSSDETVATVENGVVTAVAPGTAEITVALGDLSAACGVSVVEIAGTVYAYNYYSGDGNYNTMISMDLATGTYEALAQSPVDFIAADYNGNDGYYYGYTENGQFWKMDLQSMTAEALGTCDKLPYDMAYDYSTGIMYAMVIESVGWETVTFVYYVDLATGALIDPSQGNMTNYVYDYVVSMAADMEGNLYFVGMYGDVYKGTFIYDDWSECYSLNTSWVMDTLADEDAYVQLLQSMCYDHNNDVLIWANADFSSIWWVDANADTPYVAELGDPTGSGLLEFVGLFTLPEEIPALPAVAVSEISVSSMMLALGETAAPAVSVMPVNATNKSYTLSSSDESVVQVVDNQLKGVGIGSATVTVTLVDGENTFTADFNVGVLEIAEYVYGYLMTDLATYNGYSWIRVHTEIPNDPDYISACYYDIIAAERVNDVVYAFGYDSADWAANWQLFQLDPDHLTIIDQMDMGEVFPYVYDMAYDYTNGTMYALAGYSEDNIDLYVLDPATGSMMRMLDLEGAYLSLAAGEGKVWMIQEAAEVFDEETYTSYYETSKLLEVDPVTLEVTELMDTGVIQNAIGSMTYDAETGYLYWAPMGQTTKYESGLYVIDMESQSVYSLGTIGAMGAQVSGLHVVPEEYPTVTATEITTLLMSAYKEIVTVGQTLELDTVVLPMALTADITWSSSNEEVATVDENGTVTVLKQGVAVITATAAQGEITVSAQCRVTGLPADAEFLTYNADDMGWATINRADLSVVNLTEGEEAGVATFTEKNSRIYGYDTQGNLFYLARETYERNILGAVNAEALITDYLVRMLGEEAAAEEDLTTYGFDIRDMAYDEANNRVLALAAPYGINGEYRDELQDSNGIYQVNLADGTMTLLATLDLYNNKALTVDEEGLVYYYCAYDDVIRSVDLATGATDDVANTYSQSLYGSTESIQTLYYDDLTDMIYFLVTSNDRYYQMVQVDPDTGVFSIQGNVGDIWREGYQNTGDMLTGLTFLEEEVDVQWVGKSLSTSGKIGVNFYVKLSEDLINDPNTRMIFNVGGKTQVMTISEAVVDSSGNYRFSCYVPAKGMADQIVARVYATEGAMGLSQTFSVAAYYDAVAAKWTAEEKPELYALCETMLNYGAASQAYFGYNTDNLANAQVPTAEETAIDASGYASIVDGTEIGMEYVGASLVLDAGTDLRLFFRLSGGAAISDYVFSVDGETVTPIQRGTLYYVEVTDIAAKELDVAHTVTVGNINVSYSALSYVNNVLTKADLMDAQLVAVCQALYRYSAAAEVYYAQDTE